MNTITEILGGKLSAAFEQCGYSASLGTVGASDRPDLCSFQCNGAFAGAKLHRKAPKLIASDVAARLADDISFSKAEVAGAGFINLDLSDEFLLKYVCDMLADENKGVPQCKSPETIVIDYGGPNVAKALHIGHLRSAVIGESLKRLARATGRTVYGDTHLGDWGLQFGLVIAELMERHPDWECFSDDFDAESFSGIDMTIEQLNEIYPYASQKSKENEEFKQKAKSIVAELHAGNKTYLALWREIMNVSVPDIKANYDRLNVSFDCWYGESDAEKFVPELVETLNRQGLLYESDGAMVVDVSQEDDKVEIPPVIIKKSDGSNIYATTDLATLIQRKKEFDPNEVWYVVDSRQSLHLTQVFRCAKKAKIVGEDVRLEHLGFGTVNGEDGKPYKTRDGGVMKLSDFYDIVYDAALKRVSESKFSEDADKEDIAAKITVATIKFGDLVNHRMKDYVFDLDKFMAPDGKTGSFLLYTIARINSILRKAKPDSTVFDSTKIYTDAERDLLLKLAMSGEAYLTAYKEKAPNVICENAYKIASSFSKFYHDNHILTEQDEEKRNAWLNICLAVKLVLEKHLDILGIEEVEIM